jgi:hypothetical protein
MLGLLSGVPTDFSGHYPDLGERSVGTSQNHRFDRETHGQLQLVHHNWVNNRPVG